MEQISFSSPKSLRIPEDQRKEGEEENITNIRASLNARKNYVCVRGDYGCRRRKIWVPKAYYDENVF